MSIEALSTPCLLVDGARLHRNLDQMQALADETEVALRPHVKTHKSVALMEKQRDRGSAGLTVATVEEAEVFVEAGASDVRVAYPVTGRDKHLRLTRLKSEAQISCTVDTVEGAKQASAIHSARERPLAVLLEVDVGHGRCGVTWSDPEQAVSLAQDIAGLPGLRLGGILTHAGQAYDGPADDESPETALSRVAQQERDRMLSVASALASAGVPGVEDEDFDISIGSTPTMAAFENAERDGFRVTEIRPGNYVVNDAMQVALGSATLEECAVTVLTTVVSTKVRRDGPDRAFVDAGKKILTPDTGAGTDGFGIVLSNPETMTPAPNMRMARLSEEHGWLEGPGTSALSVGDRIRIVPNHACVCIATQPRLHVVEEGTLVDSWQVRPR